MFGKLIDLLAKQDSERSRILFFFLQLIFTLTLSTKLYIVLLGAFTIISITDYVGIISFFLNGKAVECIALFFLIWALSYYLVSVIMTTFALGIISKLHSVIHLLLSFIKNNQSEIAKELQEVLKSDSKFIRFYATILSATEVIDTFEGKIKTGPQFYKFYDFLLEIRDGENELDSDPALITICLIIQFLVIWKWVGLKLFCTSTVSVILGIAFILTILIIATFVFFISMVIVIKHESILMILKQIDPEYENHFPEA